MCGRPRSLHHRAPQQPAAAGNAGVRRPWRRLARSRATARYRSTRQREVLIELPFGIIRVVLVAKPMGGDGIAYVNRYLEANAAFGKQLGRLLLDKLALDQGSAWAFVPDPLPDDR